MQKFLCNGEVGSSSLPSSTIQVSKYSVSKENPASPSYYAVDYAICGSLTESNQILLAQMISCLTERDFYSLAQLFIFAEWVDEKTKTEELESVLRANCESLLDSPLSEILFGELLLSLFEAMRKFDLYLDISIYHLKKTSNKFIKMLFFKKDIIFFIFLSFSHWSCCA